MNVVEKLMDGLQYAFRINAATFSGAVDVVVIVQPDGTRRCSPFHVRFGKLELLRPWEKVVSITINDLPCDLMMKLGSAGEAFFVIENSSQDHVPSYLSTSPINSPPVSPPPPRRAMSVIEQPVEQPDPIAPRSTRQSSEDAIFSVDSASSSTSPRGSIDSTRAVVVSSNSTPADHKRPPLASEPLTAMLLKRASARTDGTTDEHVAAATAHGAASVNVELLPARDYLVPTPPVVHHRRHRRARSTAEPPVMRAEDSGFYGDDEKDAGSKIEVKPPVQPPSAPPTEKPKLDERKPSRWAFLWGWGTLPQVHHDKSTVSTPAADESSTLQRRRARARRRNNHAHAHTNKLRRHSDSDVVIVRIRNRVARTAAPLVAAPTPTTATITAAAHSATKRPPRLLDVPVSPLQTKKLHKAYSHRLSPGGVPGSPDDASTRTDSDSDTMFSMDDHTDERSTDREQHTDDNNTDGDLAIGSIDDVPGLRSAAMPIGGMSSSGNLDDNILRHSSAPSREITQASSPPVLHRTQTTSPLPEASKTDDAPQARSSWFFWTRREPAAAPRQLSQSLDMRDAALSDDEAATTAAAAAAAATAASTEYLKEVRPAPNVLNALKLRYGRNDIAFTVTSALQGEKTVRASLYMWDWRTKIVISDIDGTITRSDVFGHVLPTLGRDWSHQGVARLYSNINRNGFEMLYLTSRPVGSAKRTRGYIASVSQDNITLPEGPMLMSPERLLTALQVEVVARRPDIFKTQCLTDILRLFPPHAKPFYAGFGNRPTDAIAYRAIGIARHKIFIIDHHGDVRTENRTNVKTYTTLNEIIDTAFPSRVPNKEVDEAVEDEFNSFQFWRQPIPTTKLPPLK